MMRLAFYMLEAIMKVLLATGLCVLMLSASCTTIKNQNLTIERHSKEDQIAKKISDARALYDMGEIDASIAHLSFLVDRAYTPAHDEAYELLITWLLAANRYDEAKRYASYFLMHHQKTKTANRIVEIFRDYDVNAKARRLEQLQDVKEEEPEENALSLPIEAHHHSQKLNDNSAANLGILLPLSGPFANFGKKALAAISVGLDMPLKISDQKISSFRGEGFLVLVADTAGDPHETRVLIDQLAQKHQVALMIGEITTEASITASQRCEMLGIPLLTLSRHPLAREMGAHVFGFNLSQQREVGTLVSYALKKGHRRFGILYPRHNYGITMATAFYNEVLAQGGMINALEAYDAHETTFTEPVKKLVGLYYEKARPEYAECEKNKAIILKEKGVKTCKEALTPIVDFDALFIPEFNKLRLIVPALIQADILISNDAHTKDSFSKATKITDGHVVQLLGGDSWNDQDLIKKLGPKANGAFFIDAVDFNDDALLPLKRAFSEEKLMSPTSLEIFAHDAAKLASHILVNEVPNTKRIHIKNKLAQFNGSVGLLKEISFSPGNELLTQNLGFEINDGRSSVITME